MSSISSGASSFSRSRFDAAFAYTDVAVGMRVARTIDLRARDVKKAQRITGSECAGFVSADDVVRHGGDTRGSGRRGTKRAERRESRHTAFYRVPTAAALA